MPRKKHAAAAEATAATNDTDTANLPPQPSAAAEPPAPGAEAEAEGQGKYWGPPYKAIFTCRAKGFEMGENRRFKQRVFKFNEKPAPEILEKLKDAGYIYRPEEKAWTVHADNATRVRSDELAAEFAGQSQDIAR